MPPCGSAAWRSDQLLWTELFDLYSVFVDVCFFFCFFLFFVFCFLLFCRLYLIFYGSWFGVFVIKLRLCGSFPLFFCGLGFLPCCVSVCVTSCTCSHCKKINVNIDFIQNNY